MTQLPQAQHSCSCGKLSNETPQIDARALASSIRHGAIMGAFATPAPGSSLIVAASHDPLRLLAEMKKACGEMDIEYLERAEGEVKLKLTRR